MTGIQWAAQAMHAAQQRLEIATGNLANASSDAFARLRARGTIDRFGVRIRAVPDPRSGALRPTGRPFDLVVRGGTLQVRDARGTIARVGNARFTRDRFGALRDPHGRVLLDVAQRPLRVPPGARFFSDGTLRVGERLCGRLAIGASATLDVGFVMTANVDAISEMVDVLAAQRSFEGAQRVISRIEATRKKATDEVAQLQ